MPYLPSVPDGREPRRPVEAGPTWSPPRGPTGRARAGCDPAQRDHRQPPDLRAGQARPSDRGVHYPPHPLPAPTGRGWQTLTQGGTFLFRSTPGHFYSGLTLSFDPPDLARCGLFPWVEGCRSWQMRYLRKSDRSARALLPCETTLLAPPPSDCRAPPSRQREHLRDASSSGGPHPPRRHGGGAPTRPIRRAVGVARQQVPVRRRRAGDQW